MQSAPFPTLQHARVQCKLGHATDSHSSPRRSATSSPSEQNAKGEAAASTVPNITWEQLSTHSRPPALFAHVQDSTELKPENVGQMYPIAEDRIPEAFEQWYKNQTPQSEKTVSVDGGGEVRPLPHFAVGSQGLQHEFAQSRHPYLLYRCAMAWSGHEPQRSA
jgi:hypothetical protein